MSLAAPSRALSKVERDVIDFFDPRFQAMFKAPALPGAAYDASKLLLGMDLTRATQRIVHLLDDPRALQYRPDVIMQLRRERLSRQRFPRRRLADHAPSAVALSA